MRFIGNKVSKNTQLKLFKDQPKAYGGILLKTRKGRAQGRPLSTQHSMHLVLKSSLAKGTWSFRYGKNPIKIRNIVLRFAKKYGVAINSLANVGNHLHMQIKLNNRLAYRAFIRAITGAIAMTITGRSRWSQNNHALKEKNFKRFWDYRPFSRVIFGWKALLSLRDYIEINQWQGEGFGKAEARMIVARRQTRALFNTT